jgi:hypothetical protein
LGFEFGVRSVWCGVGGALESPVELLVRLSFGFAREAL